MAPGAGPRVCHVLAFWWPVFAQPLAAEPWVVPQVQPEQWGYQEPHRESSHPAAPNAAQEPWGPSEERRWRQQQTALQSGRRSLAELQQVLGAPTPTEPSAVRALSIVHNLAAQRRFRQAKAALSAARPMLEEAVLHQEVNLLRFEMGEAPPFLTSLSAADEWLAARMPLEEEARTAVRADGTLQTEPKLTSSGRLKQMTSDQLVMALDFAERLSDSRMTRRPPEDEPVFAPFTAGRRVEGESPFSPRRRSSVLAEGSGVEEPSVRTSAARGPKRHLILVQVLALTLGCFVMVIACARLRYVRALTGPAWQRSASRKAASEGCDSVAAPPAASKDWIEEEPLKLPLALPAAESNSETEVLKDWQEEEPVREDNKVIEHAIYTPDGSPAHAFAPVGVLVTPMQLPQFFQAAGVQLHAGPVQGAMLLPVPGTGQPQILPPAPYCMGTVIAAAPVPDGHCVSITQEAADQHNPDTTAEEVTLSSPRHQEPVSSKPWGFANGVGRWADHTEESPNASEAESQRPAVASASEEDPARQVSISSQNHEATPPTQDPAPQAPSSSIKDAAAPPAQETERRKRKKARRSKKEALPMPPPQKEVPPQPPQHQEEEPKRVIRLEELLGLHLRAPSSASKDPGSSNGPGRPAEMSRQTSQDDTDPAKPLAADEDDAAMADAKRPSQKHRRRPKPQAAVASAPPPRSGRQWRAGQRHVAAEEGL